MRPPLLQLALLVAAATVFAACDSVSDISYDDGARTYDGSVQAYDAGTRADDEAARRWVPRSASCPCFSRESLENAGPFLSTSSVSATGSPEPYLFFDVFNYYSLDPRRTEVRSTLQTGEGTFEEVAAVYITYGSDALQLICYRQEVVRDPAAGDLTYEYETLAPTIEEAEACRQDITAFVGKQEPCQGAACGIPYSEKQLDPDYPPYNDGDYRTPDSVLDEMRRKVEAVGRMIQLPA